MVSSTPSTSTYQLGQPRSTTNFTDRALSSLLEQLKGKRKTFPIDEFLSTVDALQSLLPPSNTILTPFARRTARSFINTNRNVELSYNEFEALLNDLRESRTPKLPAAAATSATKSATTALSAQPAVRTKIKTPSKLVEKSFEQPTTSNSLKYIAMKESKNPKLLKSYSLRTSTDRRSISLGGAPQTSKGSTFGDSVSINGRSHRERLVAKDGQQHHSRYFDENTVLLDEQRVELQSKLSLYELQLKELQENDYRRLHDIEEIEQELEATQNELQERRLRQEAELRKAREAEATLEAEFSKSYKRNSSELAGLLPPYTLDEFEKISSSPSSPPQLQQQGQQGLLSSPSFIEISDNEESSDKDSGDVNIKVHRLEEEKRSYQDVLEFMKTERTGYLTLIEQLKEQLTDLQSEIVYLKASYSDDHLLPNRPSLLQEQEQATEATLEQNTIPVGSEHHQPYHEKLIYGQITEEEHTVSATLQQKHKQQQQSASTSAPFLRISRTGLIVGTIGLCFLGAAALLSSRPCSNSAITTSSSSSICSSLHHLNLNLITNLPGYEHALKSVESTIQNWMKPKK